MLAYRSNRLGDVGYFAIEEVDLPSPGASQVRIRIEAIGLGYVDTLLMMGKYQYQPELPFTPGGEIVGIVDCVGADTPQDLLGQRVATWQLGGGLAEFCVVDAKYIHSLPRGLSPQVTAAAMLDFLTAWYALFHRGHLQAGEVVVVRGAAGGVGGAAVQIAANASAHVVAIVSNQSKAEEAVRLGAHSVLVPSELPIRQQLGAYLPEGLADIIVDPVCGEQMHHYFRTLGKQGRHLVLGFTGGTIPSLPVNLPLLKNTSLVGVDVRYFHDSSPDKAGAAWSTIFQKFQHGELVPPSTNLFSLRNAAEAIALVATRERVGKVVVNT